MKLTAPDDPLVDPGLQLLIGVLVTVVVVVVVETVVCVTVVDTGFLVVVRHGLASSFNRNGNKNVVGHFE